MKKILAVFIFFIFQNTKSYPQYVMLKKTPETTLSSNILNGKNSKFKVLNINAFTTFNGFDKFLVHFVIFSDSLGEFNKEKIKMNAVKKEWHFISLKSIFETAKKNVRRDQQREITYLDYEDSDGQHPVKTNQYKVIIENNDSTLTIYNNLTLTFFYEIKQYKQFFSAQSCASVINIKAIQAPTKRVMLNDVAEIDFPDTSYSDYFPNKIILEKINPDSSFHFIKYRKLCMDCSDNYNYEFDFNEKKGVTSFWYYLPTKKGFTSLTKKSKYMRFE